MANPDFLALAQEYAPLVQSIALPKDPRKRVAILTARVKTLKVAVSRGVPMAPALLRRAKAELVAAKGTLSVHAEGETSTRVWRIFGYSAASLVVLSLLGVAGISLARGARAVRGRR